MSVGDLVKYELRSGEETTALILRLDKYGWVMLYFSKSGNSGWVPVSQIRAI